MYGNGNEVSKAQVGTMAAGVLQADSNRFAGPATATAGPRLPHIAMEFEELANRGASLVKLAEELEHRLSPVLVPADDSSGGVAPGKPVSSVPLAGAIAAMNIQLSSIERRLLSVLQRIEL